jgi:sigma-E factor negative regulatory protein RseC
MIEEPAVITAVMGERALVRARGMASCGGCGKRGGCSAGLLARALGTREPVIDVNNSIHARVGEDVLVRIPEATLLKGAALVYGVPVAMMLILGLLGHLWAHVLGVREFSDGAATLGGLAGLAIGFVAVRLCSHRVHPHGWVCSVVACPQSVHMAPPALGASQGARRHAVFEELGLRPALPGSGSHAGRRSQESI